MTLFSSRVSTGKHWMFTFSRCAILVFQKARWEKWTTIRSRRCLSGGASNSLRDVSVSRGQVSSVKWASPKTNILIAEAGCVETRHCRPQWIVNASHSRELSLASLFLFASQNCQKEVLASHISPGITIFHCQGISRTRGTFSKPPNCPANS